jgi:hypothetical protein
MGMKGNHPAQQAFFPGFANQRLNQIAMSFMDAVKDANGEGCFFWRSKVCQFLFNGHEKF